MSSQPRMSPQFISGLLAELIKKRFAFVTFMCGGQNVKGSFTMEKIKPTFAPRAVILTINCYRSTQRSLTHVYAFPDTFISIRC